MSNSGEENSESFCFICLDTAREGEPLERVCKCPTTVHKRCGCFLSIRMAPHQSHKLLRACNPCASIRPSIYVVHSLQALVCPGVQYHFVISLRLLGVAGASQSGSCSPRGRGELSRSLSVSTAPHALPTQLILSQCETRTEASCENVAVMVCREERVCRFCSAEFPSWKEVLTKPSLPQVSPVLSSKFSSFRPMA